MKRQKNFNEFTRSKKVQHLSMGHNHALVLIDGRDYVHIHHVWGKGYLIASKRGNSISGRDKFFGMTEIFEYIQAVEPDMRKWRMS